MKKVLIIAMAIALILTLAAGCGDKDSEVKAAKETSAAVQMDPQLDALGDLAAKPSDASIDGIVNSGEMMGRAQIVPVNEDWVSVTDSE